MSKFIETSISSVFCSRCHAKLADGVFSQRNGLCACGSDAYDLTITVQETHTSSRDAGESGAMIAAGLLAGAVGKRGTGLGLIMGAGSEEATETRKYQLTGIKAAALAQLLSSEPEGVLEFLSKIRRDTAKANLRDGQGICKKCGEVFTIGQAGVTMEGYCSKLCKNKYTATHPAEAAAPVSASTADAPAVVSCPSCSKSVKIKPGEVNRCMWCGTAITLT